jgi:hypothetical protein
VQRTMACQGDQRGPAPANRGRRSAAQNLDHVTDARARRADRRATVSTRTGATRIGEPGLGDRANASAPATHGLVGPARAPGRDPWRRRPERRQRAAPMTRPGRLPRSPPSRRRRTDTPTRSSRPARSSLPILHGHATTRLAPTVSRETPPPLDHRARCASTARRQQSPSDRPVSTPATAGPTPIVRTDQADLP